MINLPKTYEPKRVERKWYTLWEEKGYFKGRTDSGKPAYSIVIPPPNVTGSLHMGHALNCTLQDILTRWKRMKGFNTLWLPGTDHAGIATQNVVERQLAEEGKTRSDLGRTAFEKRVWEWKKIAEDNILSQIRKLGCSCDWSRQRFTLDEGLSRAVREVFVRLYEEGLIYKGEYLVNWCPRCRTAISDLEVEFAPTRGHLWHIRYPVRSSDEFLVVATTRPETMLGDTAVAVHPDDGRYHHLRGRTVVLPLMDREIPIIEDSFVDREFGTGAVKVTPGHDPNDFEAGRRHQLPIVKVIDEDGRMTADAGAFAGLDRYQARRQVAAELERLGLLEKVEKHDHNVGRCQRCPTVVEPLVSTQWFLRVKPLARTALRAVEDGSTVFIPGNYKKIYSDWMTNIHDWCISRQLWWGHRIPAWTCEDCGHSTVARTGPESCSACGSARQVQESDVLDTWFSSGLWPFSTLGWPDRTRDLETFYPTSALVTGFDIIFFWVARMMMLGLRFRGDVPFRTVFITGLVRDRQGQKMSKSKGNIIDPLEVIEEYGCDAVRFTLAVSAAPGADIPFSIRRMAGYRAFCNKIWNGARYLLLNLDQGLTADEEEIGRLWEQGSLRLEDRWILGRLQQINRDTERNLERFFIHSASNDLYHFFWHEFCDWYVELIKGRISGGDTVAARVAAQHSQEFSSWYAHCPGLKVVAPWTAADAKGLLKAAIRDDDPVVFLENEILYGRSGEAPTDPGHIVPIGKANVVREGPDVTIVSFSLMMETVLEAAEILAKDGIAAEVIDLRTIRPLDAATVVASVKKTNRLVSVEEGWPFAGIGAELCAVAMEQAFDDLDAPVARVCGADVPMPYAANLEKLALPDAGRVVQAARAVCYAD